MRKDPIIEEIHRFRAEYARQFNYDVKAICKDMQEKQQKSGRQVVSYSSRTPQQTLTRKTDQS